MASPIKYTNYFNLEYLTIQFFRKYPDDQLKTVCNILFDGFKVDCVGISEDRP